MSVPVPLHACRKTPSTRGLKMDGWVQTASGGRSSVAVEATAVEPGVAPGGADHVTHDVGKGLRLRPVREIGDRLGVTDRQVNADTPEVRERVQCGVLVFVVANAEAPLDAQRHFDSVVATHGHEGCGQSEGRKVRHVADQRWAVGGTKERHAVRGLGTQRDSAHGDLVVLQSQTIQHSLVLRVGHAEVIPGPADRADHCRRHQPSRIDAPAEIAVDTEKAAAFVGWGVWNEAHAGAPGEVGV